MRRRKKPSITCTRTALAMMLQERGFTVACYDPFSPDTRAWWARANSGELEILGQDVILLRKLPPS